MQMPLTHLRTAHILTRAQQKGVCEGHLSRKASTTLAAVTTDRLGINRANNWKSHIEQSEWRE